MTNGQTEDGGKWKIVQCSELNQKPQYSELDKRNTEKLAKKYLKIGKSNNYVLNGNLGRLHDATVLVEKIPSEMEVAPRYNC